MNVSSCRLSLCRALVVLLMAPGLLRASSGRPESREPLSVLLIIADTLRADHLPAYGYPKAITPHLDRLAGASIVYEDVTAPAPFTMPSVASVFTGRFPDIHGVNNHTYGHRLGDYPGATLAETALAAGYRTGAVVTNGWLADERLGFSRGIEDFHSLRLQPAHLVTDKALEQLAAYGSDPFFLWVHYIDSHMPYRAPRAFTEAMGVSEGTSQIIVDFAQRSRSKEEIYFSPPYPESEIEKTRLVYDAAISFMDSQIGRLLEGLERAGRRSDAIVVFLSDHGESLGEHGVFFAHDYNVYDEMVRVPLMVSIPGTSPARVSRPVALLDLMPSICSSLELDCGADSDGVLLPSSNVAEGAAARSLFAAAVPNRVGFRSPRIYKEGLEGRWSMVRQGDLKLIRIPHPDEDLWELYDLAADPRERHNLARSREYAELRRSLAEWERAMRAGRLEAVHSAEEELPEETRKSLRALGYIK